MATVRAPSMVGLEFRLLGPLEVLRDGRPLKLGERQRALVSMLLLHANEVVPSERLIEDLYGGDPSGTATNALQANVSRLRRALGDETLLVTRSPGYLLRAPDEQIDLRRFERLAAEGRGALAAGESVRAESLLREALALWRGPPLAGLSSIDVLDAEARRLEEFRLTVLMDRLDADLAVARSTELVPELESLIAANPLQERLRAQLMLALYRSGRQADALAAYRETRALLREELGLEPSRALQKLERAILTHDEALEVPAPAAAPAFVCPFKGPAPFEVDDAEFFCGRERVVVDLLSRLAGSPFAAVVGGSGVGKSSILRAGLIPALKGGALPGSEGWRVEVVRPGDELDARRDGRVVLVVDQLEEIFTLCSDEDERERFLGTLVRLVRDAARRTLVVVSLRADFYGRCADYPALAELLSRNHVLVGAMDRSDLWRAIEVPASRAGLEIDRGLVESLVADVVGEPGGLPLLSTTLLELWRRRDGAKLTLDAYRRTGGVRGAVARLAEVAYAELSPAEQETARRVFLRLALGDGDGVTRRRVHRDELCGDHEVVDRLVDARLLTVDEGMVEVAHEAVLREWPRLQGWLDDDREGRRLHAHLARSAREWRGDPAELYRGARLAAAVEWAGRHERELNEPERAFLSSSRAAAERSVRRLRAGIGVLALLLVAAVAGGIVAVDSRAHARHEATIALARQLGAEAVSEPRIDRAMLLAREAVDLASSQQTNGTLLATLLRSPSAIGTFTVPLGERPQSVGVSPDGRTVAVLTNAGLLRFYDARTHRQQGAAPAANRAFTYVPHLDAWFALTTTQPAYELVDGRTHRVLPGRFRLDRHLVTSHQPLIPHFQVAASVDGRDLFLGYFLFNRDGSDGPAYLDRWSPTHGGSPTVTALDAHGLLALRLTPDGRVVVASDGEISTWDAAGLRRLGVERSPVTAASAAAFSADGRTLAYGEPDGSVHFFDVATGRTTTGAASHASAVAAVAFSRSGVVATTGDDNLVILWNPRTGEPIARLTGHVSGIHGAAFDTRGTMLYTSSLDGTVLQWDVAGGRGFGSPFTVGTWASYSPLTAHTGLDYAPPLAISPDGRSFAAANTPSSLSIYSTSSLRRIETVSLPRGRTLGGAVAWSGRDLAVGDNAGTVDIYTPDGRLGEKLDDLKGVVRAIAASGGELAATSGVPGQVEDGWLALWRHGRLVRPPLRLHAFGDGLAFTPNGSLLAVAVDNRSALVVDPRTGRVERTIHFEQGPSNDAGSIAVAPDGTLALGGNGGVVGLWSAGSGRALGRELDAGSFPVAALAFDPTKRTFVTVGDAPRLWSTQTEQQLGAAYPAPPGQWGNAAFTPDGRYLIDVRADGSAERWPAIPTAWAAHACAVAGRNFTREEWSRFVGGRPYAHTCP